ncbi:helix-turn-helix domain-containing protein [Knoellia sp. 3-2P3]|uniref:helix-turn-helix domain-containing protein n=1 Tax=unclassified Knoellia TaxID=2618719 RepID=UPI0023DCD692|nr:helix-turn-helix domain-containing protein [Knoellia sp. 3-2P3]MDF2090882.1 helix-turn-helix domain-containing protein [Knoellia sp. 3-2P3]
MGSWTNATPAVPSRYAARPAPRRLPPDARRPATATTAGILRPREHATVVELDRPAASPELETWVEHYWTVRWDLGDAAYRSEVVPHPAVHLSVESGTTPHHGIPMPAALVHGVVTTRFTVDLAGEGRVFGVKFRPGGFGGFTGEDVGAWTGRVLDLRAAFGDAADALREAVLEADTDEERVLVMDAFLMARRPGADAAYERLLDVVAGMLADPALVSVEAVCHRYGVSVRTLQRLFRRYVGVGPKWVLRRYRLHDAVALIDAGEGHDLAALATRLGWYDQAHFTRDFTEVVGRPPSRYAASGGGGATRG